MAEEFKDKNLTCRECGKEFVHSAEDQKFYQEKGYENEPVRCPDCRSARKRGGFDGPREMHKITCAECGKEDEVPFKPAGDRPVYCKECFAKKRQE